MATALDRVLAGETRAGPRATETRSRVPLLDGSFTARSHRTVVLVGYATGALVGLGLWAARPSLPWWPIALEVVLAGAVGFPMANGRYRRAAVRERQRMQWFGCALAIAAEVA